MSRCWNVVLITQDKDGNFYSKMDSMNYHFIDGRLSLYNARKTAEKLVKQYFGCEYVTHYAIRYGTVNSCYDLFRQDIESGNNVIKVIENTFSVIATYDNNTLKAFKDITINQVSDLIWNKNIITLIDTESGKTVMNKKWIDPKSDCWYRNPNQLTKKLVS